MSEQKLGIRFWEQCGEKCFLLYTILRWTNKVIPPNPFQTAPARDQTFRYTNLWDHSHSNHHIIKDYMWKLYFCLGQAKWMSDTGNCQIVPLIKTVISSLLHLILVMDLGRCGGGLSWTRKAKTISLALGKTELCHGLGILGPLALGKAELCHGLGILGPLALGRQNSAMAWKYLDLNENKVKANFKLLVGDISIILSFRRLRQGNHDFKASIPFQTGD